MVQIDRVLDEPPTGVSVSPAPRRRRWRALIFVAIVVVIGALVAGGIYLVQYQPLGPGNGGSRMTTTGSAKVQTVENAFGTDWRVVAPKPGDRLGIEFPITNSGPLSVKITRVGQPFNPRGTVGDLSHQESTSVGQVTFATWPSPESFRGGPLTLAPGENAQVRISFSVLPCAKVAAFRGRIDYATTVAVTYATLGFSHTRQIALGAAYSIVELPTCP